MNAQQGAGNNVLNTQTVFSTCHTSNHMHQVQTIPNVVTFATSQRGPVLSTATQGAGSMLGAAVTTSFQATANIPNRETVVGRAQPSQAPQYGLQQPHTQATIIPGSHWSGQAHNVDYY